MPSFGDTDLSFKNGAAYSAFTFNLSLFFIIYESANWSSNSLYVSVSKTTSILPFGFVRRRKRLSVFGTVQFIKIPPVLMRIVYYIV